MKIRFSAMAGIFLLFPFMYRKVLRPKTLLRGYVLEDKSALASSSPLVCT
jgi:hypothetical protein